MTDEIDQPLNSANWPVFIVDIRGLLKYLNAAGGNFFGEMVEDDVLTLDRIWSEDNTQTSTRYLSSLKGTYIKPFSCKFRIAGGGVSQFRTYVCRHRFENENLFLFQLFPENQAKPAPVPAPTSDPKPELPKTPLPDSDKAEPISIPSVAVTSKAASSNTGSSGDAALRQKLDCALKLARTVSLDFNNALTSVLGHTSLILSKMPRDHEWRASLVEVEKSASKAAEIAYDLANFSHEEKGEKGHESQNINDILRNAIQLFSGKTQNEIEWLSRFEKQVFSARFDEAKLLQAITKILENAIQSIPGKGKILVKSYNITRDATPDTNHLKLKPGDYVCVEVQDNGKGIEIEIMPRIFEPFFTTKPNPPHRGLGLAWVYGIITNHGGGVTVDSHVGSGTSVKFYLPAESALVQDETVSNQDLQGSQTILMVDDEDLLLTMGETILSSYGYQVLTANTGAKALDIIKSNVDRIELLITDMVMPNMSGRELIEHVRKIRPDLRIICATGYIRSKTHAEKEPYLMKPFNAQDLLRKVRQVIKS